MKHILHILLALTIVSCSQKSKQNEQHSSNNQDETHVASIEDSFDFYSDKVLTHIDAEELCEFSFDFFLPQLNQKLAYKDLKLDVQTADDHESSFEIVINGHQVKLYENEELSNGEFWDSGPRKFFRVVNDVLKENDIDKKFYLLYAGNDLHAVFLTEQQFELMTKTNKDNINEIPYLP